MVLGLALIASLFALVYFLRARKTPSIAQRYRERRVRRRGAEQPIDPNFQFDAPPDDGEQS
jgi:hypothetical protein